MIERKFVSQNMREFEIKQYLFSQLTRAGLSDVKLKRTPLGDKVVVYASRPGLVVGKGGSNIQKLTRDLKKEFDMENPQIEIEEVKNPRGNAAITAELIANSLERFGSQRFKGVGHKALSAVMDSGALGVEILISGKIPSSRAKRWRFYQGYLKKCGDLSVSGVESAHQQARLKTGLVGIVVKIMPASTVLPDNIELLETPETVVESEDVAEDKDSSKKKDSEKKSKSEKSKAKKSDASKATDTKATDSKKASKAKKSEDDKKEVKEKSDDKKASSKKEDAKEDKPKAKSEQVKKDEA